MGTRNYNRIINQTNFLILSIINRNFQSHFLLIATTMLKNLCNYQLTSFVEMKINLIINFSLMNCLKINFPFIIFVSMEFNKNNL